MKEYSVKLRWGRDKESGYDSMTCYADGKKRGRCIGGGYDMKGAAFGIFVESEFAERLRTGIKSKLYGLTFHDPNFDPGKAPVAPTGETVAELEAAGKSLGLERYQAVYAASSPVPTERHTVPSIDGACGFDSVERIINAIGGTVKHVPTRGNNSEYVVTMPD